MFYLRWRNPLQSQPKQVCSSRSDFWDYLSADYLSATLVAILICSQDSILQTSSLFTSKIVSIL